MVPSGEPSKETIGNAFRGDDFAIRALAIWAQSLADAEEIHLAEVLLDRLSVQLLTIDGSEWVLAYVYFALGRIFTKCDRHLDAAALFKRAYELHGEGNRMQLPCAANRALALTRAGVDRHLVECEFKKELRDKEIDEVKQFPSALLPLGVLHFAVGDYPTAKRLWEKAEKANGAKKADQLAASAALNLANLHIANGDLDSAKKSIDEAASRWAGIVNTTTFGITEADLAIARSKWSEADNCLDGVLKKEPTRPRALYRKGVVASRQQKWEEAERWFQETISVAPWHAKAQTDLGRIQLAREGAGPRPGLLGLSWCRRLLLSVPMLLAGLAIALTAAWCQPDQVTTTRTWGTSATPTSASTTATAVQTPGTGGAQALTANAAPASEATQATVTETAGPAVATPTPSTVTEQRVQTGFHNVSAGVVTIASLIIAIGVIIFFLPEVKTITWGGFALTPLDIPPPRPFFSDLDLGGEVEN